MGGAITISNREEKSSGMAAWLDKNEYIHPNIAVSENPCSRLSRAELIYLQGLSLEI